MIEKTARVCAVDQIATGVLRVDVEMIEPSFLDFRPGQFVSVRIAPDSAARRSFSIASSATRRDGFELLLRSDGKGKAGTFASDLRPGQPIQFLGPMGFFGCAPEHRGEVVFVATGVGIAPMFSMIDEVLSRPATSESGRVDLFWGLRSDDDMFFIDRLDALSRQSLRFQYHMSLSEPSSAWSGTRGYITHAVLQAAPTLIDPIYYLCGNGDMIRDVTRGLERVGHGGPRRIRTEAFSATVAVGG